MAPVLTSDFPHYGGLACSNHPGSSCLPAPFSPCFSHGPLPADKVPRFRYDTDSSRS
ncbi:hypothetical protein DAEQUDRAFT_727333 [Daedalea quercina L-15889]|uniref:Uncharacterized protein n=1 Tax=Daedalea quercina L-15889 TaxID=1314783 RepID=A0A165Q209_9APHY|nr:hypothetical protein DAEQUDRAFT_727333 [Daedalea quercina L-15889]